MPRAKSLAREMPDSYFALVKEFPLAHLRNEADLGAAQAMLDRLLGEELDEGGEAYLDVLSDLVEVYEDARHPMPKVSPGDTLRLLMESNALTQAELARKAGVAARSVSAALSGTRALTTTEATRLAGVFKLNPSVFLADSARG